MRWLPRDYGTGDVDWFELGMYSLLGAFVLFIIGVLILVAIDASTPHPTIELRKDQWQCTDTHTWTSVVIVPAGKAMIPIVQNHTECRRYERI